MGQAIFLGDHNQPMLRNERLKGGARVIGIVSVSHKDSHVNLSPCEHSKKVFGMSLDQLQLNIGICAIKRGKRIADHAAVHARRADQKLARSLRLHLRELDHTFPVQKGGVLQIF